MPRARAGSAASRARRTRRRGDPFGGAFGIAWRQQRGSGGEVDSELFGPDVSEMPQADIPEARTPIEAWCQQFVNRWVFLAHQRPDALAELRQLLAEAQK